MVGGVYKIEGKNNEFYIGSCKCFTKRKQGHNDIRNNPTKVEYETKKYIYFRENNITIELIPLEVCDPNLTSEELKIREQHYIDLLHPTLNKRRAYTSSEMKKELRRERNGENSEKIAEYNKDYYNKNKVVLSHKTKAYKSQEHVKVRNKSLKKTWDENNRDKVRANDATRYRKQVCKKALNDIISQIELMHS